MKKIAALLLAAVTVLSMVGCGKSTFVCDMCGNEVNSKKHVVTAYGEKGTLCDDCYKSWKALESLMGALGDM